MKSIQFWLNSKLSQTQPNNRNITTIVVVKEPHFVNIEMYPQFTTRERKCIDTHTQIIILQIRDTYSYCRR